MDGSTNYKVLLVEDSRAMGKVIKKHIKAQNHEVFLVENKDKALEFLQTTIPDLIIYDTLMTGREGSLFRDKLRFHPVFQFIPFLFLTNKNELESKIDSLNFDIDDYTTIYEHIELLARVDAVLKRAREYKKINNYDELTGLINAYDLENKLTKELKRLKRYNKKLSVLMLDIDDFKTLSDTHGHVESKNVLVEVAKKLTAEVRDCDFISRTNWDTFIVVMTETPKDGCILASERIREHISEMSFGKKGIKITVSGGVVSPPEDGEELDVLLDNTNKALYNAKINGKNKIVPYMDGEF